MRISNERGVVVWLELSAWKREKHVFVGLFEF